MRELCCSRREDCSDEMAYESRGRDGGGRRSVWAFDDEAQRGVEWGEGRVGGAEREVGRRGRAGGGREEGEGRSGVEAWEGGERRGGQEDAIPISWVSALLSKEKE